MPIILDTQKALRPIQNLPFCYLCGNKIETGQTCNDDHVPPSAIFTVADRNFPLILPTHLKCNNGWSDYDEIIGQLVGFLHGTIPNPTNTKLRFIRGKFSDGSEGAAVSGIDLRFIIRRFIRAFHAALYGEPLKKETSTFFATTPPFPVAYNTANGVKHIEISEVVLNLVEELKRNKATGSLDRIICRNGKCRYECVWSQADDGHYICIYAFDLYDWKRLGDGTHFKVHGCVGVYRPEGARVPSKASRGTRLIFRVENLDKLDPFGS